MAEIVNLRLARKRAERQARERAAEANRQLHGRPAALRKVDVAERQRAERILDGHRLEPDGPDGTDA